MAIQSVGRSGMTSSYNSGNSDVKKIEEVEKISVDMNAKQVQEKAAETVSAATPKDKQSSEKDNGQIEKDNEKIKRMVSELNKRMANTECQFGIHESTGRVTIKLVDRESKEILKEYPTEETLDMMSKMWDLAGIKVDKKL